MRVRLVTTSALAVLTSATLGMGLMSSASADIPTPSSTTSANVLVATDSPTDTPTGTASTTPASASDTPAPTTSSAVPTTPGTMTGTRPSFTTMPTTRPTTPAPTTPGPVGGSHETGLTAGQVASQVAAANAMIAELAASNKGLADLLTAYNANATKANALLERYDRVKQEEATATAEAEAQQTLADLLAAELATDQRELRAWAFHAYSDGGSVSELAGVLDALSSKDPATVSNPVGDLTFIVDERSRRFSALRDLAARQVTASQAAATARTDAATARSLAATAKSDLAAVMKTQRAQVEKLRSAQSTTVASAGPVLNVLAGVRTPAAIAAYNRLMAQVDKSRVPIAGLSGPACSKDERAYPNGMIPPSGLCPLWQAPGESLRPGAAAAFNAMSRAYAKATGRPLCVTDSYRTLAQQYAVKATRGRWAATPGRSPHGLGIAVDLCGGVQTFYSPAYLWMLHNGPSFGWYHPSWLDPGSSLPEPWHWQYAG